MNARVPILLLAATVLAACSSPAPRSPGPRPLEPHPAGKAGSSTSDDEARYEEIVWSDDDRGYVPWPRSDDDEIAFGFGGAYWNELESLDPDVSFPTRGGFGSLQSWGFGLDLAYHRRIARSGNASVWLGGRLGVQGWEERASFRVRLPNGEVIDDDVTATTTQAALSLRFEQELGGISAFVGGGGGYYGLDIEEEEDHGWGRSDRLADDGALGGFVSLGLDFETGPFSRIRLENLTHFVTFEGIDSFTPGEDSIQGPINVIQFGFVGRF